MGHEAHSQAHTQATEQAIFAEALERDSPGARAAFLEEACGANAALRQRIEDLLIAFEGATDFLEEPPAAIVAGLARCEVAQPSAVEKIGERIDRYRLLEPIGEGGCGVVYMAEQLEPVQRRVALKVIKLGMDTRAVIARFEAERQALALMDHPNIARVFDGGATQSGRPYFVMELVRGVRITEFCDQNKLSTPERLELFIRVCHAIQHAHQKGVIHRDIKPSNILVTINDGVAVPKVIDFGIAKATGQRLTEKTLFTQFHSFIGTPAYTSPEQAEMSSVDIDTRSDIYSLGVLLFELLTGKTPFAAEELLQSGLDGMRRIIREQEPPRPSTVLRRSSAAMVPGGAQRNPRGHSLPADLDWIVMKCLEKDRARRYESAAGLAADLQRHLSDEPVLARPPSFRYRAGKWIRKHTGAAIAASLVMLAVSASAVVSTTLYLREQKARRSEAEHRVRAEVESAKSAETAGFLIEMLSSINPDQALGRDVSVLTEMLERASVRIESEFKNHPEVEASLRLTIGRVYRTLAQYAKAASHLERARELRERLFPPGDPEVIRGWLELVNLYSEQGRTVEADALCRRALEASRQSAGASGALTIELQQRLALLCLDQRKFDEAERMLGECVSFLEQESSKDHLTVLRSRSDLAAVYLQQRKFGEADRILHETVPKLRQALPKDHPGLLRDLANFAGALHGLGRLAEAEPIYRETWEANKRVLGPDHQRTLIAMQNLGTLLSAQGRHAEAESLLRELLDVAQRTLGPDHPRTVRAIDILGVALGKQKKHAEAEALARQSMGINARVHGPEHSITLRSKVALGDSYARRGGHLSDAEQLYRETLAIQQRVLGPAHNDSLLTAGNLLLVLRKMGSNVVAEALCQETLASCRSELGIEHRLTQEWSNHLATVTREMSPTKSARP